VQHQLGISDQVHNAQERSDRSEGNQLSVRLELQADCLAGVWANHAQEMKQILEPGDVEEALNAASAIGDDRLTKGRVSPDSFTHGTSEQRSRWFRSGFQTGKMSSCDTFNGNI
jgi:predicted metalloprotease